jgi:hypothetical protein
MTTRRMTRRFARTLLALGGILGCATPAAAQLDPLLFVKRSKPNVILIVDTSHRMLYDGDGAYYDPADYATTSSIRTSLALTVQDKNHRRKYVSLQFQNGMTDVFATGTIAAAGSSSGSALYSNFYARSRIGVAKAALLQAVRENSTSVRFGLVKTRQASPAIPATSLTVTALNADAAQANSDTGLSGRWLITVPTTTATNHSQTAPASPNFALVRADSATANTDLLTTLNKSFSTSGALLPAGRDAYGVVDSPLSTMLADARSEASRLITADVNTDKQCRNTVAVLVVGGGEGTGYTPASSASAVASQFLDISGRRVPVYVVALAPAASQVDQLKAIATNSGGQYFEVTQDQIDSAVDAGMTVPEVVRAVNTAIQHAFTLPADLNVAPTSLLPYGKSTEFQSASPIVGTVDLYNAEFADGTTIPETESRITTQAGTEIPQRSNVMITAGLSLPGFDGKLRGYRVYKPVPDTSKPSGYRFDADGKLLWVATTPVESQRNIFTALPDGTLVAFSAGNAGTLSAYLNTFDAAGLISFVRSQPIGAIVGSTPAVVDPPSIDPAPDTDYIEFIDANKERRTLVVVGGNDGMVHVIDARTGLEVWAYIPFNLLPKLKTLRDGQPIDAFDYFVDSSPKIADVKVANGGEDKEWRTYLIIGQGPGGTFYQAFDITMDGLANCIGQDENNDAQLVSCFSSPTRIPLKWSFPRYSEFDYTFTSTAMPYGDLKSTATTAEMTVGQTWSDPAVGQVASAAGPHVIITGSGFFPYTAQQSAARAGAAAGRAFYVLDAETGAPGGQPLAWRDVGSDGKAETVDDCTKVVKGCTEIKNALQADPVATGAADSRFITKAFIGDLDGKVWSFTLGLDDADAPTLGAPVNRYNQWNAAHPLFSSMAAVTVGTQQYLFFGTGSELLPSTGVTYSYKLVGIVEGTSKEEFTRDLEKTDGLAGDEKVTAFPAVAGDIVFFTTTKFKPTAPCSLADANLYALTFIGGAAYASSNDSNDKMDKNESPIVKTLTNVGRATAPFIVDQHLWFGTGENISMFGDPSDFNNGVGQVGVRILSWRHLR